MIDQAPDKTLRRHILRNAAASTTALSLVDTKLPPAVLDMTMRAYLAYFRALTGSNAVEIYITHEQEAAMVRLNLMEKVTAYHVPWQKSVGHIERLVQKSHPKPIKAIFHAYEWISHFYGTNLTHHTHSDYTESTINAQEIAHQVAFLTQTEPTEAELDLLDQAATNHVILVSETVVDRELYTTLARQGISHEQYLFDRLSFLCQLRDRWLMRHGDHQSTPCLPIGVALNPWHVAMEMRGTEIDDALAAGQTAGEVRQMLLPLLTHFYQATEGLVQHFYVGNSRPWELKLPEILQRGRFLDPDGVIPELDILRLVLADDPRIADAVTLEASPQSAIFSGRLVV
ncbi:MAG: hypothetical protein AAF639_06835 [Chloroflexota bacterium]